VTNPVDRRSVAQPRAGAVVLHPHPRFGGDRHHPVVGAIFEALPSAGIDAVRFDFRLGADPGDDVELGRRDAGAALDGLRMDDPDLALAVIGYSFGAAVGMSVEHGGIRARIVIAPPFGVVPVNRASDEPTLVLVAAHDQFAPPDVVAPLVAAWPDTTLEIIESTDHFLVGRAASIAARVVAWLDEIV
jgi:alpha/beta superfamily hydrolase